MFEHLCRGLMRTLISYSDLPMLPPSSLGWVENTRGCAEKALKDELLKLHELLNLLKLKQIKSGEVLPQGSPGHQC